MLIPAPILTFDLDGVLCRPPFGINPGRSMNKPRTVEGRKSLLWSSERMRYAGRKPMPGAREGFLWFSEHYDCRIVSARSERAREVTESWLRRYFGIVPEVHLRPDWRETAAAYKLRKVQELGATAHFEDDPHTAAWLAEHIPAVLLIDWWRNRWLKAARVHRIHWIAEAGAVLRTVTANDAVPPILAP